MTNVPTLSNMLDDIDLGTELVDPRFTEIDEWPPIVAVEAMLEGQLAAVASLHSQTRRIACAAQAASRRLGSVGRLVYAGAGTSGRIAVQDGVELTPTYNWPADRLAFLLAGGEKALMVSVEGAEDDTIEASRLVASNEIGSHDVVIGVAASGSTPFTLKILEEARRSGALTIGISNNKDTPIMKTADFSICLETGSEVVAGSTRMKAGTAQKAVLNILSSTIMLKKGLIYRGMMVNMRMSNNKLRKRGISMVSSLAGVDRKQSINALDASDGQIGTAVLVALGAETAEAERLLTLSDGNLKRAISAFENVDHDDG